jgi:hypothetical protein
VAACTAASGQPCYEFHHGNVNLCERDECPSDYLAIDNDVGSNGRAIAPNTTSSTTSLSGRAPRFLRCQVRSRRSMKS